METDREIDELRNDEAFAALLRKAPPRPAPPAGDEAIVRAAVHAEWQAVSGGRVRRRRTAALALAASVLLAVLATFNLTRDQAVDISGMQMAAVDKQFGSVMINSRNVPAGQLASIEGGDVVQTGVDSGLALGWHDGGSLRIDENTVVVFEAANQVFLREGRLYFDSVAGPTASQGSNERNAKFEIRTSRGRVHHLGTQYMTQVADDELVISVREGVVAIVGEMPARASAGQQLAISASGALSFDDTNGVDDWEWVEKTSPAVNLDGLTIDAALDWVGRESGRNIQYASEAAALLARVATVHGDYDMKPSRALELFMLGTDLNARIEGEVIVISED